MGAEVKIVLPSVCPVKGRWMRRCERFRGVGSRSIVSKPSVARDGRTLDMPVLKEAPERVCEPLDVFRLYPIGWDTGDAG